MTFIRQGGLPHLPRAKNGYDRELLQQLRDSFQVLTTLDHASDLTMKIRSYSPNFHGTCTTTSFRLSVLGSFLIQHRDSIPVRCRAPFPDYRVHARPERGRERERLRLPPLPPAWCRRQIHEGFALRRPDIVVDQLCRIAEVQGLDGSTDGALEEAIAAALVRSQRTESFARLAEDLEPGSVHRDRQVDRVDIALERLHELRASRPFGAADLDGQVGEGGDDGDGADEFADAPEQRSRLPKAHVSAPNDLRRVCLRST
jgi:hypothetical protein